MQIYWNKRKSLHKDILQQKGSSLTGLIWNTNMHSHHFNVLEHNSGQRRKALLITADVTSYENTLYSQWVQCEPTSRCCSNHGWCMSCTSHLPHSISMSCKASCSMTLYNGCLVGILETWNNLEKCHKTLNTVFLIIIIIR